MSKKNCLIFLSGKIQGAELHIPVTSLPLGEELYPSRHCSEPGSERKPLDWVKKGQVGTGTWREVMA